MSWLEKGLGGEAVACLASYTSTSMRETYDEFLKAFSELNVNTEFDEKTLIFIAIQHYLRMAAEGTLDPWYACNKVILIELKYYPMIKLFKRSDCDKHFEEKAKTQKYPGKEYAGQYFGIERLVELNYRQDDYDVWTESLDVEARDEIKTEAKKLLITLFSDNNLPLSSDI